MNRYRAEIIRPAHPRMPNSIIIDVGEKKDGVWLSMLWSSFMFLSFMMMIVGYSLHSRRLFYCGCYVAFELALELFDMHMSWQERRLPITRLLIELNYTKEDRQAVPKDENGRELP